MLFRSDMAPAKQEVLDNLDVLREAYAPKEEEKQQPVFDKKYDELVVDRLVDIFTEKERPIDTSLTAEQKADEAKRVKAMEGASGAFYKANEAYSAAIADAEAQGIDLYGSRGRPKGAGKKVQALLDKLMAAKQKLLDSIPAGEKTFAESILANKSMQDAMLLDVTDVIDSMRKGEFFGGPNKEMATGSLATKAIAAKRRVDQLADLVIAETDYAREAKGLGRLTNEDVFQIKRALSDMFGYKIAHATGWRAANMRMEDANKYLQDLRVNDVLKNAGFEPVDISFKEGQVKTGFSRNEYKDVQDRKSTRLNSSH